MEGHAEISRFTYSLLTYRDENREIVTASLPFIAAPEFAVFTPVEHEESRISKRGRSVFQDPRAVMVMKTSALDPVTVRTMRRLHSKPLATKH